jgi:biotin carboxyl carrier protein
MKLHAEIDGNKHEVDFTREDAKVFARVDDREYELEASEPEPGVFLFKHEGRVYEASVVRSKSDTGTVQVRVGTYEFEVRLTDPKRLRGVGSGADHSDGLVEIKTAMPGKVVRVLTEPGAVVEKGDSVLVVEAMKMQNELKSPKAGTIRDVRVAEGDAVGAGDILATIE